MNERYKYIFLGGAARSGTTLVQKILLANDAIAGGAEFYHTRGIFELYNRMHNHLENGSLIGVEDKIHLTEKFRNFYDDFFTSYLGDEVRYISEKTPSNIEVIGPVLEVYPEAIFINIFRDGRAVLNSHLKVKRRAWENGKNLTEINIVRTSMYWRSCIQKAREGLSKYEGRFYSIRYEAFIDNPAKELKQIFLDLEINVHDHVNTPEEINFRNVDRKAHINGIWYTEDMYSKGLDGSRKTEWTNELNFFQKLLANIIMYPELKYLEYKIHSFYRLPNYIFDFVYFWRKRLKNWYILKPIIRLKRRLQ